MLYAAQEKLLAEGIDVAVVSMPSWDLFEKQDDAYKQSVLPKDVKKRLGIEMGVSLGWHKYVGDEGELSQSIHLVQVHQEILSLKNTDSLKKMLLLK